MKDERQKSIECHIHIPTQAARAAAEEEEETARKEHTTSTQRRRDREREGKERAPTKYTCFLLRTFVDAALSIHTP